MIRHAPHKLIAQTYDGAAALSGVQNGVQALMKDVYPSAYLIHCYAHQFNLILQKAISVSPEVKIFFYSLSGIPAFFPYSLQRMAALERTPGHHIPSLSTARWNFQTRTVNAVKEMKDGIIECCDNSLTSRSQQTGFVAAGTKHILKKNIHKA